VKPGSDIEYYVFLSLNHDRWKLLLQRCFKEGDLVEICHTMPPTGRDQRLGRSGKMTKVGWQRSFRKPPRQAIPFACSPGVRIERSGPQAPAGCWRGNCSNSARFKDRQPPKQLTCPPAPRWYRSSFGIARPCACKDRVANSTTVPSYCNPRRRPIVTFHAAAEEEIYIKATESLKAAKVQVNAVAEITYGERLELGASPKDRNLAENLSVSWVK